MAITAYSITDGAAAAGRTKLAPGVWHNVGAAVSGVLRSSSNGKIYLSEDQTKNDFSLRNTSGKESFYRPDGQNRGDLFVYAELPPGIDKIDFTIVV